MENVIKDYLEGMSWSNLQHKYSCSSRKIYKILNNNNIPKRKPINKYRWSKEKQELLKNMYLQNCTYKEMYNALDCKGGTLTYWVHQLGLPMRGSGRNKSIKNPFLINTPERDYWLGYLFADGHIGQGSIRLFSKEEIVIKAFDDFCNNQCNFYKRNYVTKNGETKTIYQAILTSVDIQRWFSKKYSICSNKKYTLNPSITLNWNILKGYFDGDGNAHRNGGWTITTGSKIWAERVRQFLENNGIYSSINEYKNCYKTNVWRKEELYKLVPKLYQSNTFYLQYKYDRLEPYMSNHIMKIG